MADLIDRRQLIGDNGVMMPIPQTLEPEMACSAPLVREPLADAEAHALAAMFKALAEPARLRLLSLIASHQGGEACVCDLTEPVDLSQPTVSHHLKIHTDAGLITRDKRGRWAYYAVASDALDALGEVLRVEHKDKDSADCR